MEVEPFDDGNFPIIESTKGPIQGRKCLDYQGTPYYSFVRVPYAVCPTGANRFKHLERRQTQRWIEPMDCTMDICGPSQAFFEETCLYCNIFTPDLPTPCIKKNRLKPVMVFLPGENPTIDTRECLEKYGPQFLMTEKVVVVVVSYRTGILGFAKVKDEELRREVPGFAAHSDIKNFFIWLATEIARFGGSPEEITVFGQGVGAALIADMLYDTHTWLNVTKVIIQSINGDCLLGPRQINIKNYATFCGFAKKKHTERQVLDILREMPVNQLIAREKDYLKRSPLRQLRFDFLRQMKLGQAGEGIAAVLIGFNSNEGIVDKIHTPTIDQNLEDVGRLLKTLKTPKIRDDDLLKAILVPEIKEYFFKGQPPTHKKFMQILSDLRHNLRSVTTARLLPITMNERASIFSYRFDVDGGMNLVKRTHGVTIPGACFGDELGYLFKIPDLPDPQRGSVEEATVRRMIRIWANFAKHGEPNMEHCQILGKLGWKSMNEDLFYGSKPMRCMNIGPRLEYTGKLPELYRFAFWCNAFYQYVVTGQLKKIGNLFCLAPDK